MSLLNIRKAGKGDAEEASKVFETAFAPLDNIYGPIGDVAKHRAARAREGIRLVAERDGRIVGTVQYAVHAEHVHLIGLAVSPGSQRSGVGRALVEWVVELTPSLDRSILALDTVRETGNVQVFERMGFRIVREHIASWCESKIYDELHEVIMELETVKQAKQGVR